MIVSKYDHKQAIVIDLTGPEGNAFVLLGKAKNFARQLGYNKEEIKDLLELMQSSDYENLVALFESHFGSFVTLLR